MIDSMRTGKGVGDEMQALQYDLAVEYKREHPKDKRSIARLIKELPVFA